jgi:hypothetical protein
MALAVAIAAALAIPQAAQNTDEQVQRLIERTRTTQATYALVSTNEIRADDKTTREFAAEFNQGDLHRIETPRDRIVANCRTGWAAHLNVASGAVTYEDGLASVACGIFTGDGLRDAKMTGSKETQFGPVQQLSINTFAATRTYEVAANGAIVAETIADQSGKLRLIMKAISLSDQLPSQDIFSEDSLNESVVPVELKRQAEQPGD